jgi:LPS sulfotransferase NodH
MIGPRFILFAHPRSGSTTLANVLDAHPDLRVLMEPFLDPKYAERIVDCASLNTVVGEIFAAYHGFKTISWPLDFELYAHLLTDESRQVIFLRRRNILKASLSCAISHRTGAWQKKDLPREPEVLFEAIGEIPLDEITEWIEAVQGVMDRYEAIVDARTPGRALKLAYEELYGSTFGQVATLYRIFDFLGVRRVQTPEINALLDRGNSQMNSQETYRWVRNFKEIDEIGARNGWGSLFE